MDTELLKARALDTVEICEKTNKPKFFGFLSKEESVFICKLLENRNKSFELFGGYPEANRVFLCCFPQSFAKKTYPISAITLRFRKNEKLSHRDFLGGLMALGLKRESVGDILIGEDLAVLFVCEEIADYIMSQLEKVGNVGVKCEKGFIEPLPKQSELAKFSVTLASPRLDCVVSALVGCSRAQASQKISKCLVSVNSVVTEKITKTVSNGDIVSIKKIGKFIIDDIGDLTKKNRLILKFKKYI